MFLMKLMRVFRFAKCKLKASTWIPIVLYVIFISCMLKITFPNGPGSSKKRTSELKSGSSEEDLDQGELNRVFHSDNKDVFQDVNPIVFSDNKDAGNVLRFAFRKADSNSDGSLTIRELAKYINLKICDHIDSAIKRNPQIFSEIDKSPTDGLVSWSEYHTYFLKVSAPSDIFCSLSSQVRLVTIESQNWTGRKLFEESRREATLEVRS